MKNLICNFEIKSKEDFVFKSISILHLSDTDSVYVIGKESFESSDYSFAQLNPSEDFESESPHLSLSSSSSSPLSISCLNLEGALLYISQDKQLFRFDPLSGGESESLGSFDFTPTSMICSPDGEFLAISSDDFQVHFLSALDFNLVNQINLSDKAIEPSASSVSVNWGSKSTQFHGLEGKEASKLQGPTNRSKIFEEDRKETFLSWRNDGKYFAASFVNSEDCRIIKVYDSNLVLYSISEIITGLDAPISWRPDGPISVYQRLPNKNVICFIEKNGLKHGEIVLHKDSVRVTKLNWNSDGSILAISFEDGTLELWTTGNYHWYSKLTRRFSKSCCIFWHPISPMKLLVQSGEEIFFMDLSWSLLSSLCRTENDVCLAGSIDRNVLKVTPFKTTVIPPPLCAYELILPSSIRNVCFGHHGSFNDIAILTDKFCFYFYEYLKTSSEPKSDGFVINSGAHSLSRNYESNDLKSKYPQLSHLFWTEIDSFVGSVYNGVVAINRGQVTDFVPTETPIYNGASNSHNSVLLFQSINGVCFKYDVKNKSICPWIQENGSTIRFPGGVCSNLALLDDGRIVGLDYRHRLYLNGVEIETGISSFFVHSSFFLWTSYKHVLKISPISDLRNASLEGSETVRSIERGSKIILACPEGSATILQLPRGNLEVINPRPMAIKVVQKLLDQSQYGEAYAILRRHRINLNLIVDHNRSKFLTEVSLFLDEIKDLQRICIFIADLKGEDVTRSTYSSAYKNRIGSISSSENKIESVCQRFLVEMKSNSTKYLRPIISCLIKQSKIEDALFEINLQKKNGNFDLAEDSLKFLIIMVDVNKLYDIALGTYDFDLVMFVAEKSTKDPKEYIPFLNHLKDQPKYYRQFLIDKYLQRYEKSLNSAVEIEYDEKIPEVLDLIKNQRIYVHAIKTFLHKSKFIIPLCDLYGGYLFDKKYFEDSALIYELGNHTEKAINSWIFSNNWKYGLSCAVQAFKRPSFEWSDTCIKVINRLIENKKYKDAGDVYFMHMNDPENAVDQYTKGGHWSECLEIIHRSDRLDIMESNFKPVLLETADNLYNAIVEKSKEFKEKTQRLWKVFEIKEKITSGFTEDIDVNIEDDDLYSELSSHISSVISKSKSNPASLKTRNTQRSKSSKNRRKQEKKKYSMKEGSVYEDLGLIADLYRRITLIYDSKNDVGEVIRALVKINEIELAAKIQSELKKSLQEVEVSLKKIWINEVVKEFTFGPEATTEEIVAAQSKTNGYIPSYDLLESHFRHPPYIANSNDSWMLQIL